MRKLISLSKVLFVAIAAALLVMAVLPAGSVAAAGLGDDPAPATSDTKEGYPRLERAFRLLERQEKRQGRLLDRSDDLIKRSQALIDRATEKGLDASNVQAALDDFEAALPAVRAAHAEAAAIVDTHTGFDADGKVVDPEGAKATIEELRSALKQTREAAGGTGKALLQAIRDFLKENRDAFKPEVTPEP